MKLLARLCSVSLMAIVIASVTAQDSAPARIRFATFNVALDRAEAGQLTDELRGGDSKQAHAIAEIVQRVRPDVLLLNELDYDSEGNALAALQKHYFAKAHGDAAVIEFAYAFFAPVNAGVSAGVDVDGDGKADGAGDVHSEGAFPGQGGMAVLSRFPIDRAAVRTFQKLLWREVPEPVKGPLPPTRSELEEYYSPAAREVLRLSSKSHWDVPISIDGNVVHLLASHPSRPEWDGERLRHAGRTLAEIRLWSDYISPRRAGWIRDDAGRRGGLAADALFVVAGSLNADPAVLSTEGVAINRFLRHMWVDARMVPASAGSYLASKRQGGINARHRGRADTDTSDFDDRTIGNLRLDYVLPSRALSPATAGVFWPAAQDPLFKLVGDGDPIVSSDHRMVWLDVRWPSTPRPNVPLTGQPFGRLQGARFLAPFSFADHELTLVRWWTNGCPFCAASLPALEKLRQTHGARGLAVVGMYHPKPQRAVADREVREHARALGFKGDLAVDSGWDKLADLQMRGAPTRATSISMLVDRSGKIVWVHAGPRLHPDTDGKHGAASAGFTALEALLRERLQ